jgi:hypothetical protein
MRQQGQGDVPVSARPAAHLVVVVGIDRDPEVGSRFQLARGQPWNYSPDAFKN